MPLIPTIIPAYIKIHDRDVETPTSISPTSASPFETTTTSPSPMPTDSGNSRWVFRSWDDTTIAFTVIIAICVVFAVVLFCASYIQAYLKSRRGSRNAPQVEEQMDENATARQNKWYNRLKRQTSSQTRSPEGIPLEDVRTGSRSRASSHQTNAANAGLSNGPATGVYPSSNTTTCHTQPSVQFCRSNLANLQHLPQGSNICVGIPRSDSWASSCGRNACADL